MLKRVPAAQVSHEHLQKLFTADANSPEFFAIPPAVLIANLWDEVFLLYSCDYGLALLDVFVSHSGQKRLNIVRFAGEGLAQHFQQISRDLQHIARELGCVAIETMVYDEKLARTLRRGGAFRESVNMVLELDNGRR